MASKFKSVQDKVNDKNDKQIDNYKMIISFANTGTGNSPVVMSVENDTVIAGGNQFSNFGDLINGTGVGSAVTSAVKSAVGLTFGVAGVSTIPQIATRLNWTGSQKPQFAFQVSIYNEDSDKSVLDEVMKIKQAVYPSSLGESKIKLLKKYPVFKSPLGYKVIDNKKNNTVSVTGTLDVKVGRWLFLRNMVVISENFTFSKEVNRFGHPLFVRGNITFETHQALTFKEFEKMILTSKVLR